MFFNLNLDAILHKCTSLLSVVELLQWKSGYTIQDRIRNECIEDKVGIVPTVKMM